MTDNQTGPQSFSAPTPVDYAPGVNVEKLISADGGTNWYFTADDSADTIAAIHALTGIASTNLHIGAAPALAAVGTIKVKTVVTNTGDVTETFGVTDSAPGTALNGHSFVFAATSLAPGQSLVSTALCEATPSTTGTFTDTATVTAKAGGTTLTDADSASFISTFTHGVAGLTIGYWYNHPTNTAWKQTGTQGAINLGYGASPTGGDLRVQAGAALQLINSSQSANDTRQILMSQAEAAELNVIAGATDPGGLSVGHDLLSEAVYWLEGRRLSTGAAGFVYADKSSGNVDANHNGIVNAAASGLAPAVDYNTATHAFTFGALTSSKNAWNQYVDTGILDTATGHDFTVDGEGLKNALMDFNQGSLVTSAHGQQVAWFNGSSYSDFHMNNAAGMWSVLTDHAVVGIHA